MRTLVILAALAATVTADEAPRVSFGGTLTYSSSRRTYGLTVPVTAKIGDSQVQVSSYDLPLVLPEGTDSAALEKLLGQPVQANGYLFGEPRQLLVVDVSLAGTTHAARREEKGGKTKEYVPEEVKEKK